MRRPTKVAIHLGGITQVGGGDVSDSGLTNASQPIVISWSCWREYEHFCAMNLQPAAGDRTSRVSGDARNAYGLEIDHQRDY